MAKSGRSDTSMLEDMVSEVEFLMLEMYCYRPYYSAADLFFFTDDLETVDATMVRLAWTLNYRL